MGKLMLVVPEQAFEIDDIEEYEYDGFDRDELYVDYDSIISDYLIKLDYYLDYEEEK